MGKNRHGQPLNEQDYAVLVMHLTDTVSAIKDEKRRHRLDILAKRLGEFQMDLQHDRLSRADLETAQQAREEQARIDAPRRQLENRKADRERLLAQHDVNMTGPWGIFQSRFNGESFVGHEFVSGFGATSTWSEVVEFAAETWPDQIGPNGDLDHGLITIEHTVPRKKF